MPEASISIKLREDTFGHMKRVTARLGLTLHTQLRHIIPSEFVEVDIGLLPREKGESKLAYTVIGQLKVVILNVDALPGRKCIKRQPQAPPSSKDPCNRGRSRERRGACGRRGQARGDGIMMTSELSGARGRLREASGSAPVGTERRCARRS